MKRLACIVLTVLCCAGCATEATRERPAGPGIAGNLRIGDVQISYAPGVDAPDRLQILLASALLGKLVQRADVDPNAREAVVMVRVYKVQVAGKSAAWTLGIVGGKNVVQAEVQVVDSAAKGSLGSFQAKGEYHSGGFSSGDSEKEVAARFSSELARQIMGKN